MTLARMQQRRDSGADWAASNPVLAQGEIGMDTDTGLIKIGDGTTAWNTLRGLGLVDYAETVRTAGDLSFNTTGWQTVSTTLDVALLAKAGDLVAMFPNFGLGAQANQFAFDIQNVTSGVYWSSGTTTPTTNGTVGWLRAGSASNGVSGPAFWRVQSGDLSSGIITMRLKVSPTNTTARAVAATAASPARMAAINYGLLT